MTIKRLETLAEIEEDGEVIDDSGRSLGRAHLSLYAHRNVFAAGTHDDGDAEVPGGVVHRRARVQFVDSGSAATLAFLSNELTICLDNGGKLRFQMVNTRSGDVRITHIE